MKIRSIVTRTPAAGSPEAVAHFESLMRFETDCWDVHHAIGQQTVDFVLLDVRSRELFEQGHVPGAVHLPYAEIRRSALRRWPEETTFVVYCSGPHCNGADKAALRLARLGRPVKKMIGGVEGWKDEGYELERAAADSASVRLTA